MTIGAFLSAAVGPLARKVLAGLGVGVLTFAGVGTAVDAALDSARGHWDGLPADVVSFLAIAGAHQALGLLAAGLTARATLMTLKRFGFLQ